MRDDAGTKFGTDSERVEQLAAINAGLRARGVRGRIIVVRDKLFLRGTYVGVDGNKKERKVALNLPANPNQLLTAESRVVQLAAVLAETGALPNPLPWEREITKATDASSHKAINVEGAIEEMRKDFWAGRAKTSAAERSWDRLQTELKRLPAQATLTTDLLTAVAAQTAAGSRTRLEACKVFKRLGKLAGLEKLEQLDALRSTYEPAERCLPADEALFAFIREYRESTWGWATAALVVYGCRPSEVFSLKPASDGTAQVLTIKRKDKAPAWRTALALPRSMVEELGLMQVEVPLRHYRPADYDSAEARKATQRWGKWLRARTQDFALYDIRHAWAVRSISAVPTGLAAKCMGHSLAVHHSTYHRWLDQADIASIAAQIKEN